MSLSLNRHYAKVWAKKFHFAKKCNKAKCMICHPDKVMGKTKHSDKKKQNND